jgi:hypothetical protein
VRKKLRKNAKVFISHASKDRSFVKRVVKFLKKNHIRYWYSESHIPGAAQWHDEIGRALNECGWFLLVLSPNAVKSPWAKRELLYALRQNRYKNRIIPVLFRTCKLEQLSWTLPDFEFVDFRKNFDAGCQKLLRLWKRR